MLKMLKPNFFCLVGLVVMMLLAGGSGDSGTSVTPTSPAPTGPSAESPHEKRLAELNRKRDGIYTSIAIEREVAKKLAGDAMKLSQQPLPDPDERQFLMEKNGSTGKAYRRIG